MVPALARIFKQGFRADCHFRKFIVRFFKEGIAPGIFCNKTSPDCCGIARLLLRVVWKQIAGTAVMQTQAT